MKEGVANDLVVHNSPLPRRGKRPRKKTYKFSSGKAITRAIERKREAQSSISLSTINEGCEGEVERIELTDKTEKVLEDPSSFSDKERDILKASRAFICLGSNRQ